ncbi:hypothetical protein OSB04_023869 [Centaurea solstitialis]|uniref:RNase H type-1 domain-containing protein n=1 Tax=Centaurea solstitialis TaxID=347529 RepID=A0AA38W033_9ASTR|nr:hypothetical protein OSB04_023869 [Centaurea solstitialis]
MILEDILRKSRDTYEMLQDDQNIPSIEGEIVGCKIGLYPRSQVGAQSEDKGKVKVVYKVKKLNLEQQEPTMCDEVHNVMIQDNKPWLLYVDVRILKRTRIRTRCCLTILTRGNMVYSIRCEFKATNNEEKYEALIAGLDIAHKLGAKHLYVRINGDFQAKDSKMTTYLKIVKNRVTRFDHFLIEQIPRDLNTQADALANLGSAFNDPSMEIIPILHLTTPTIEIKE